MTYCISYCSIAIIKYSDRKPLIEDRANFGLTAPEGERVHHGRGVREMGQESLVVGWKLDDHIFIHILRTVHTQTTTHSSIKSRIYKHS